jgi:hypothetical protein
MPPKSEAVHTTAIFGSWTSPVRSPSPAFRSKHLQPLDITRFQTISNYIPAGRRIWRFHSFQLDVNAFAHAIKALAPQNLQIAGARSKKDDLDPLPPFRRRCAALPIYGWTGRGTNFLSLYVEKNGFSGLIGIVSSSYGRQPYLRGGCLCERLYYAQSPSPSF